MGFELILRSRFRSSSRSLKSNECLLHKSGLCALPKAALDQAKIGDALVLLADHPTCRIALRAATPNDPPEAVFGFRHDKHAKPGTRLVNLIPALRSGGWLADQKSIFSGYLRLVQRGGDEPMVIVLLENEQGTDKG